MLINFNFHEWGGGRGGSMLKGSLPGLLSSGS